MNQDFEYYKVDRSNDDSIPLLANDSGNPMYQYRKAPIEAPQLTLLRLGEPIPRNPKMADYLSLPSGVISRRIFEVLNKLNIEGIQLLPARIRGEDDQIFDEYWLLHIFNSIRCIDLEKSICSVEKNRISNVQRLILDKNILEAIPLEARLIFRLQEDFSFQLFHSSIVKAIMIKNPTGIRFTNIEQWHPGILFEK